MIIPAEALLIRPQRIVDPFNRISKPIQPTLLAVEFCQIEGPRPLSVHTYGAESSKLDLDALCVWLMSSETAIGTILSIFNQQMAIYAFSYHCVFFDIHARAFQRPVCFAYLSSQKPTASQLVKFTDNIRKIVTAPILCNRRFFLKSLVDIKSTIESSEISTESIQKIISSPTTKHKYQAIVEQVRKIYPRAQQIFGGLCNTADSDCRGHSSSSKIDHTEMLNFIKNVGVLRPLQETAPCSFSLISPALEVLLTQLARPTTRKGALYSGNVPVLRLSRIETPIKMKALGMNAKLEEEKENSLRTLTPHLDNILFNVLAGEDLVICGSVQRKQTVVDIVEKLNALLPRSHTNYTVTSWAEDAISLPHGVVGLSAPKTSSISLPAVNRSVLDLNTNTLRTIPYVGNLLSDFHHRRRFPSDDTLLIFICAVISRLNSYIYLARHIPLSRLKSEGMSDDDEKIVANLLTELDMVKYQAQRCNLQGKRVNQAVKNINL